MEPKPKPHSKPTDVFKPKQFNQSHTITHDRCNVNVLILIARSVTNYHYFYNPETSDPIEVNVRKFLSYTLTIIGK